MNNDRPRTTVALRKSTKSKLDSYRAPGQCYDGFIRQLIQTWEAEKDSRSSIKAR